MQPRPMEFFAIGRASAAFARESHEIERTALELEIINVAVLAASVVNFPNAVRPAKFAPFNEAHVMQSLCDDRGIVLDLVMACACGNDGGQRDKGCATSSTYDTGDFSH